MEQSFVIRCARRMGMVAGLLVGVTALAHAGIAPAVPTFQIAQPGPPKPGHIAFDSQGNAYVTSYTGHRVRKLDPFGNLLLEWGSAGTGDGQFNGPWGVAVDASDVVFVTDYGNDRIQKFTSAGVFIGKWGSTGTQAAQLRGPDGLAIDAAGNVYVTEYINNRVQKFTNTGGFQMVFGFGGSGQGQFNAPEGIHVAANGTIYVADSGNHRVQYFGVAGDYLGQWGTHGTGGGQFKVPTGIAADAFGALYVAEWLGNRVQRFTSTGIPLGTWGSTGTGNGQFSNANGIALDAAGNVYVADHTNDRIQKFSVAGAPFAHAAPVPYLGYDVIPGAPTILTDAGHMATDASGNLYVALTHKHRVFKLSSTGAFLGSVGTGLPGSADGQFNQPFGVAVDGAGNVYVSELSNNRVQKFSGSLAFLGKWGSSGSGPGQFSLPYGIQVDAAGVVWVCDAVNHRIQRFTSSGTYLSSFSTPDMGPTDLDFGPDGNLYVGAGGVIRVFTPAGTQLREWFCPSMSVDVDASGFVHASGSNEYGKYSNLGVRVASTPSLPSPPTNAFGVHIDAGGNVYLAFQLGVYKCVDPPMITQVIDLPNDQGRVVKVRFQRTSAEAANTGVVAHGYSVQRRIEWLPGPSSAQTIATPMMTRPAAAPAVAGYDFVGYIPATGATSYEIAIPTLANANPSSRYYSGLLVQAITNNPLWHFESAPEFAASIDNIAPPVISPFAGSHVSGSTYLHWGVSAASDFAGFRLYKGGYAFTPGPGNLLTATTDTSYVDTGSIASYKVTAVDFDGNESYPAALEAYEIVDVRSGPARPEFALDGTRPSPARASGLIVHFTLPIAAPARLEMFDVAGRRVVSRDVGSLGAGVHSVNLSESAGGRVAAGLYFLRLRQGANERRVRITVLD